VPPSPSPRQLVRSTVSRMAEGRISVDDPRAEDVRRLLESHLAFANSYSPPEDVHALGVEGLLDPDVTFFGFRLHGELLGVGALKKIDDSHAELKSMHTAEKARRHGIGKAMVDHLVGVARARGFHRVSIETGSMAAFAPARQLYLSKDFLPCDPFGDYRPSGNSTFMSLSLGDPEVES
jgi:putative acetyltransferase